MKDTDYESNTDHHDDGDGDIVDKSMDRLNDLNSQIGFGKYQWTMFVVCGFGWMADNMWFQILSATLPQVQAEFQVSDSISGLGLTCFMVGMIPGSLGWGVLSDLVGRRLAFALTLTLGGVFGTAAAFAQSFTMYCLLLAVAGVGVGGNIPVDGALFLEFIPKERQSLLMLMSCFWPLGSMIGAGLSWGLIPNHSCDPTTSFCDTVSNRGWRYSLGATGLITLTMLLLRMVLVRMRESPKWLISMGRVEDAVLVLKDLAEMNGKTIDVSVADFNEIKRESQTEGFRRFLHALKGLFVTRRIAFSTSLIWLIWMMIGVAYCMFYGFLPKLLLTINPDNHPSLDDTYRDFFIQTLCGVPGTIAGTFLIETAIGRKGTMAVGAIGVGLSLFLFTTTGHTSWQLFFNCIASFLSSIVYGVLSSYTSEVFDTRHRGTAVGMATCLNKVVSISAPFLSGVLIAQNPRYALYLSAALFAVVGGFASLLPIETRGRAAR